MRALCPTSKKYTFKKIYRLQQIKTLKSEHSFQF